MTNGQDDLNKAIEKIRNTARKDNSAALAMAETLVKSFPDDRRVWSIKGLVHALVKNYDDAISCLTKAINLTPTSVDYFARARHYFKVESWSKSAADLSKAIETDNYGDSSYREILHFWRAEALLKLNKKQDAERDIQKVSPDHKEWTFALRTKQDLLNEILAN